MTTYYFDFRSGDTLLLDQEGTELNNIEEAHGEAINSLASAITDYALAEGAANQRLKVEVRDEFGQVLEIEALLSSRILRKE